MPKKHQKQFQSSHPYNQRNGESSSSTTSGPSSGPGSTTPAITVNERLEQLRIAQVSPADSLRKKAELAERSSRQQSLPPGIAQILGVRETPPPAPKPGVRLRTRMRTPGPAPPPSWVFNRQDDQGATGAYRRAPRPARTFGANSRRTQVHALRLCRFSEMIKEHVPRRPSLLHTTLLAIARYWDIVEEDALDYVAELPLHLRSPLLSYLAAYPPEQGISIRTLRALTFGHEPIRMLDLSALVGYGFSISQLTALLTDSAKATSTTSPSEGPSIVADEIPAESWDIEGDFADAYESVPKLMASPISASLTKLSLSRPGPSASWTGLLRLTSVCPMLTHLSLAYWPFPTRTPNMLTATYDTKTGPVRAGGSTFYSGADADYEEAALVLHQLSKNTYCLRWLDLEGCTLWMHALTWSNSGRYPTLGALRVVDDAEWTQSFAAKGPDWTGAWRQLTYLNLSQGDFPNDLWQVGAVLGSVVDPDLASGHAMLVRSLRRSKLLQWLEAHPASQRVPSECVSCGDTLGHNAAASVPPGTRPCGNCETYAAQYRGKLETWLTVEDEASGVGRKTQQARGSSRHGPLMIDLGRTVMA